MKQVAILHQGLEGGNPSLIKHSCYLRDSLVEAVRDLGYNPQSVYLDDSFTWVSSLEQIRNLLVVVNAADYGPFFDSTLESVVPAILDKKGIRYTGSDMGAIDFTNDKLRTNYALSKAGVLVPKCFSIGDTNSFESLDFPLIIKYRSVHGSEGIDDSSVVMNERELKEKVDRLKQTRDSPIIAEQYIQGSGIYEVCGGFLGNGDDRLALPVACVKFNSESSRIRTQDHKWSDEDPIEFVDLPESLEKEIHRYVSDAANAIGMRDYARIDFRIGVDGRAYAIDTNANPDLNEDATLYKMASKTGLSYPTFVGKIIDSALRR
ncbi:MAG: hypothetical protein HY831_01175 [Candidatus Aenigmarchaeota archaeon]|nr:hypothetical protein [Candidatus Aenigmarchaeota archaeon]